MKAQGAAAALGENDRLADAPESQSVLPSDGWEMDIDFHYFITYLIAARAGYSVEDASVIAHASQSVDDNYIPISVDEGKPSAFLSQVTKTSDCRGPREDDAVYFSFHFIPGGPSGRAERRDRSTHALATVPGGVIATEMLEMALDSGDTYRIGVASHAYVDSWAHQNFVGARSHFNAIHAELGCASRWYRPFAHRDVGTHPDIPGMVWTDPRLVDSRINNRERFLDAAEHLFRHYAARKMPPAAVDAAAIGLRADLADDIGAPSPAAKRQDPSRIGRYQERALTAAYGGSPIPAYSPRLWVEGALNERLTDIVGLWQRAWSSFTKTATDAYLHHERVNCSWIDANNRGRSDWYRFQRAVMAHFDDCLEALRTAGLMECTPNLS